MSSKFKESLGFISGMIDEHIYHTEHESEFCEKYVEELSCFDDKRVITELNYYSWGNIYHDLYHSFVFIYEIDGILDEIICDGISLNRARSLLNYTDVFLRVVSTNVMMDVDCSYFNFSKKYHLAEDLYDMVRQMYDGLLSLHSGYKDDISLDETITVTKYDEIFYRLNCKFIRNGINVIKLFLILVLFRISPVYSDGIHEIARKLMDILRDTLFDKRILKSVIDFDTKEYREKSRSTTLLKIYFVLSNSDRYCIRLDFPHKGAESIHLNLNEPARKSSTGFPFRRADYIRVSEICGYDFNLDRLFYKYDDLYWFRSNYTSEVKQIKRLDVEVGEALEEFLHDRAHLDISSKDNKAIVSEFTEDFEEAIVSYDGKSTYGNTRKDDAELFQLILFQDYIMDATIKLRYCEMETKTGLFKGKSENELKELEEKVLSLFCEYIKTKFPDNAELQECAEKYSDLSRLINGCLDYFDKVGV